MDAVPCRAALYQCYSTPLIRKSTSFFASLSSDRLLPSLDVRDRSVPQTIE
uniref:Uncharacterized protein n=1 Tax=Physcomitrium patens TaxID=3218 RepID=A0A2K1J0D4_PHYPA|nr:hypothetical protein PHYPA_022879 [Physcomitrium patens]